MLQEIYSQTSATVLIKNKEVNSKNFFKKVLVSYPKVTKKYGKYTVKQTAWDVYEVGSNGSVAVDLSHLNPTKDNYVAVRDTYSRIDDGIETMLVEIPANDILKKGTYDAKAHSMVIYGPDGKTEYEGSCLYRTPVSPWKEYTQEVDLSVYENQGTTLYVKPTYNPAPVHEYTPQGITEGYRLMIAGSFAGKELKVKVTKLANAPAITADYTKRTFTVNMFISDMREIRVLVCGLQILNCWSDQVQEIKLADNYR